MRVPIIGLLPEIETIPGSFPPSTRTYVNTDYLDSVLRCGGNPTILPFVRDPALLEALLRTVDGLLVTGGRDVDPLLYGEAPIPQLGPVRAERDRHDLDAIRLARSLHLPVFGICRGLQVLNVAFGGTLHQDIGVAGGPAAVHTHPATEAPATHRARFEPDSLMERIFGSEAEVNSYHHQSIKGLAPFFRATGFADDGTIEAIEARNGEPLFAVQWHPERMVDASESQSELFRAFVRLAGA
jgi:putative glutamine amidotransferase